MIRPPRRRGSLRAMLAALTVLIALAGGSAVAAPTDDSTGASPAPVAAPVAGPTTAAAPDIIVIMTDDQRAGTERAMPYTSQFFRRQGVHYGQAQVPTNLCCPARASFLTGQYAHTTGVWENSGDHGGFGAFRRWKGDTLPQNLQQAGYETALFGKYINHYNRRGGFGKTPAGWDVFHTYSDVWADGGYRTPIAGLPRGYTTDVLGDATAQYLTQADPDTPVFAMYSPFAPHAPYSPGPYAGAADPALLKRFRDAGQLTNPSFREADLSDKPQWLRRVRQVSVGYLRRLANQQARVLMGVDNNVRKIIEAQQVRDPDLSNTVVVYLSDNGVAWGDHRLRLKRHPYVMASRIPLMIKYPVGVTGSAGPESPGTTTPRLVNQLDVTQTLAQLAGAAPTGEGLSLLDQVRTTLPLEASSARGGMLDRPGFCGVRTSRYLYLSYTDGTRELYDYARDPYELENAFGSQRYFSRTIRLDGLLDPGCNLAEIATIRGRNDVDG